LTAGEKLGHYEIIASIGAGGMGEVYRARDPRLNREVAIKLLPPTGDKTRFQTEAKALAALNHPNIVAIFDVGDNYLVTELIDGAPMKATGVRQAIDLAAQAADGLSAAHSVGIFHRDIKPQNILVTHEGRVKLIDFGLAKDAMHGDGAQTLTAEGTIMGTAPYMSPEQVRGQKLDARSDLFSLGAVLYEQLAAKRPFQGETVAQTMSAVLEKEPSDLPETVPAGLKQIVYRCLAKDKAARFQNAADLSFALRALGSGSTTAHMHTMIAAPAAKSQRLWQGVAAAAILAGFGLAAVHFTETPPAQAPPFRLVAESPEDLANSNNAGSALSPDGRILAFVAAPGGRSVLYVRPLDSLEARIMAGTEGAGRPFWSPDSKSIGYFANGKVMRIDLAGGAPQPICEGAPGRGGTWNEDGVIVFSAGLGGLLRRVSASGGEAQAITEFDAKVGEDAHYYPQFLPDGQRFLYFRRRADRVKSGVYVGQLGDAAKGRNDKMVLETAHRAVFAANPRGKGGHLLFIRGDGLFSQPFDPESATLSGEPALLAQNVSMISANAFSDVSASSSGIVAYALGGEGKRISVRRDRAGKPVGEPFESAQVSSVDLSPDGTRLASSRADAQTGDVIWITEIARNTTTRFVFDGPAIFPTWSPDGQMLAFVSRNAIYIAPANGAGKAEKLYQSATLPFVNAWSPDGKSILFSERAEKSQADLWVLPVTGDRKPTPVVQGRFNEASGALSPDGRWLLYTSDETGKFELYVQGFPEAKGKWMISAGGTVGGQWRNDGKEILYWNEGAIWSVSIQANETGVVSGKPEKLFNSPLQSVIAADGKTFYTQESPSGESKRPIAILMNWQK
jgi:Tol biopolymer transport system component/predicted Ser/Thr protein kinase